MQIYPFHWLILLEISSASWTSFGDTIVWSDYLPLICSLVYCIVYVQIYLFISQHRIVGCLVAEPIKEAFKVVSCSIAGHSDGAKKRETRSSSTTLQFGNIVFQREVEKRAASVSDSEVMDGSLGGAIFCESKAVAAVCGIRAIWVTPSNRRKRIAVQMLEAVR